MIYRLFIISFIYSFFIQDNYALQIKPTSAKTINIGLLISDKEAVAAKNGATIAIDMANKVAKSNGNKFNLVVRSMEGPWGTGSIEATNLIFNEKVWAILGSHDGRNAHLVEQVITKTQTVFLSAWATDPTLYQAFVPWFFSCVPNDMQQAEALIKEIYDQRKLNSIAVFSDMSYDSNLAMESFIKQTKKLENVKIVQFNYDDTNKNIKKLIERLNKNKTECIVLFGKPKVNFTLIEQLHQNKMNFPIFSSLSILAEDNIHVEPLLQENDISCVSSGNWLTNEHLYFTKAYQDKYGKKPGAIAAYAYDGMHLLMEAIQKSGYDREKLQETLSKIHYNGITGLIQFDKNRNRMCATTLIRFKNDIPDSIEK